MADSSPVRSRLAAADTPLRWLLGIFVGGLLLVIGLRLLFAGLQEELSQRSANERARLFIGEEIVRSIHGIEKDIYQIASTGNLAGVRLLHRSIDRQLEKLNHDLAVLQHGGRVRREILLNIEGRDEMVREVEFSPGDDHGLVMELIEIAPLLEQTGDRIKGLVTLLEQRWAALDGNDPRRFFAQSQEIDLYLKHIPPYFKRLDENANRLFFDSSERLRTLESELALQRSRLEMVEMGLVALVVAFVGLSSVIVMRRIRRANDAREQALEDARQARDEAEQASRAKSEFVSRMSHELRTPLNAIIGFAELLELEPLQAGQKHYVSLITRSGNHLMELVNAVLDHAKIEAGNLTLESIAFDLPEAIHSVRSMIGEQATRKGLNFVADISPELPRHVEGDPTRLRQVLINLLVNAVKFTDQGTVELHAALVDKELHFTIRDTGIGMDEAALARLFQPFAQADETITRKFGGTGLGLLISKELVEAMGGGIAVESTLGAGTSFRLWLPCRKAVQEDIEPPPPPLQPATPDDLSTRIGGRVLLVDDNTINQRLGAAMLGRLGLSCDLAGNGLEALERLAGNQYALVLMDMEMPEMDGLTATAEIRRRESGQGGGQHLPVIALTANALVADRERCFAAGMDGYVAKPISLAALETEITRLFPTGPAD